MVLTAVVAVFLMMFFVLFALLVASLSTNLWLTFLVAVFPVLPLFVFFVFVLFLLVLFGFRFRVLLAVLGGRLVPGVGCLTVAQLFIVYFELFKLSHNRSDLV